MLPAISEKGPQYFFVGVAVTALLAIITVVVLGVLHILPGGGASSQGGGFTV